ncbi:hypothetical protein [Vandammella animalimorsus]|nr:hypothetical protein [Vandammella animalimorsus]
MTNEAVDPQWDALWQQRWDVLNLANITHRYHRKREAFFDRAEKLTQAASAMMGLSLLGETVQQHLPIAAAVISGLSLLALVFGYSQRRQLHKELAESACALAGRIDGAPLGQLNEAMVRRWQLEMAEINRKEPPNLMGLVRVCEYEQAVVDGHPDHAPAPSWWLRIRSNFF